MGQVVTIGLDTAKSVLQVHGVGADGEVLVRSRLTRRGCCPSSRSCRAPCRHRGLQ